MARRSSSRTRSIVVFVVIQGAILLFAIARVAVAITAGQLGASLGCTVDESGPHPCELWGMDIGNALYSAGVFGWLTLATMPVAAGLWLAHIVYVLVRLMRTRTE